MMGAENNQDSAHLQSSKEGMESLSLDNADSGGGSGGDSEVGTSLTSVSYSNYRSAMTALITSSSFSSFNHPLSAPAPADANPLFFPPSPSVKSPSSVKITYNYQENNFQLDCFSYADVSFSPLDESTSPTDANGDSPTGEDSGKYTFSSRSQDSGSSSLEAAEEDSGLLTVGCWGFEWTEKDTFFMVIFVGESRLR